MEDLISNFPAGQLEIINNLLERVEALEAAANVQPAPLEPVAQPVTGD